MTASDENVHNHLTGNNTDCYSVTQYVLKQLNLLETGKT